MIYLNGKISTACDLVCKDYINYFYFVAKSTKLYNYEINKYIYATQNVTFLQSVSYHAQLAKNSTERRLNVLLFIFIASPCVNVKR